jgi:mono/diheme cytochrome c family protein
MSVFSIFGRLGFHGPAIALLLLAAATAVADESERIMALESNDCVPTGNLRGNAEAGTDLHVENCAECHGYDGKAEVIVMHMDEPPRDQTDVEYMEALPDMFLYLAICKGGEAVGRSLVMPGWGDYFTDQEIRDLVAWIRTFSGT